ncbi:MAG: SRPBCC domain-containing protein [Myxococcota bacterium]|nr:SRPBCC domain-containing protein [Myxococcota bacterium]
MKTGAAVMPQTLDREIVQERMFDAPRELVWRAWTDPAHSDKWWGPNGFRNETSSMDFRVGGAWGFVMHGPDGKRWDNWIRFEEISQPERLVYSHGDGEGAEPAFHVTVTFTQVGRRTKLTMRSLFPTADAAAAVKKFGAVRGGQQTLARLAGYLPGLADGSFEGAMVLSRLFDAPRKLVFDAWSSPQQVMRWWGPKGFTLPVCEMDFRTGGAYRMAMRSPDGTEHPFNGTFQEIVPNERIVFSALIGGPELRTVVSFVEDDGKTLLTVRQDRPADDEARAGMTQGWSETLEKLGAIIDPGSSLGG